MMVPRQQACLGAYSKVFMFAANWLPTAAVSIEELNDLIGIHSSTVIYDDPAIGSKVLHGLPLNRIFDSGRICFDGVLRGFPGPLKCSALPVGPLNEMLRPSGAHGTKMASKLDARHSRTNH